MVISPDGDTIENVKGLIQSMEDGNIWEYHGISPASPEDVAVETCG